MTLVASTFVFDAAYRPLSPRNWYRKGVRFPLLRGELFFRWNCRSVWIRFERRNDVSSDVFISIQNLESLIVSIWMGFIIRCWDSLIFDRSPESCLRSSSCEKNNWRKRGKSWGKFIFEEILKIFLKCTNFSKTNFFVPESRIIEMSRYTEYSWEMDSETNRKIDIQWQLNVCF